MLPGNFRDSVQCKGSIKADRVGAECEVCHLTHGAVVKCNHGHCQVWGSGLKGYGGRRTPLHDLHPRCCALLLQLVPLNFTTERVPSVMRAEGWVLPRQQGGAEREGRVPLVLPPAQ